MDMPKVERTVQVLPSTILHRTIRALAVFVVAWFVSAAGCQTDSRDQALATDASQVALRQIQSRAFDTTDTTKTLRTVISTLQDLGFVIDKADGDLGTVSATKLKGYQVRMTVTVLPRGETQLIVRANAQYNDTQVAEAQPYQQFFAALEKAMFLTAQQVD